MKKILVLFVAVMLALPAMSYAGSATSRWDLTIGGMVKFDVQWADQAVNSEVTFAERKADTGYESSRTSTTPCRGHPARQDSISSSRVRTPGVQRHPLLSRLTSGDRRYLAPLMLATRHR